MPKSSLVLVRGLILCPVVLGCFSHLLYGQLENGAILGTVSDTSGAVIPAAKVTLVNEDTGLTLSTTTAAGALLVHSDQNRYLYDFGGISRLRQSVPSAHHRQCSATGRSGFFAAAGFGESNRRSYVRRTVATSGERLCWTSSKRQTDQ